MYAQKSQRGSSPRFHYHHGSNIVFENNQQTAIRSSSFANAICFSERHLAPGEIFLVEIEEIESGWSGHMRIGLTQMNPNTEYELPLYALPDLVSMGPCWLYAITKRHNNIYEVRHGNTVEGGDDETQDQIVPGPNAQARRRRRQHHPAIRNVDLSDSEEDPELPIENYVIENNPFPAVAEGEVEGAEGGGGELGEAMSLMNVQENSQNLHRKKNQILIREGDWTWTPCGFIQHKSLMPKVGSDKEAQSLLPTDVGSRIGVMFNPTSSNTANMHFIINGEDQGPCARNIPYDNAPIYAVVDVYGSTKRIRTVQVYGVDSLQSMCRDVILQSIHTKGVTSLPLPNPLKAYLLFH